MFGSPQHTAMSFRIGWTAPKLRLRMGQFDWHQKNMLIFHSVAPAACASDRVLNLFSTICAIPWRMPIRSTYASSPRLPN